VTTSARTAQAPTPATPRATVTWVGHATVRYDLPSGRVLTDPLLTSRVAHLRRRVPVPPAAVADVAVVLLSHAHMDHLHRASIDVIPASATLVVAKGLGGLVTTGKAGRSRAVVEIGRGETYRHGDVTIEAVHAEHRAGRGPHSRVSADPVGFVIAADGVRAYFPGDTALFPTMADLAPIDVATIPIWGWGSTLGTGHLDPAGAVEAIRRIAPKVVIPMHWGTYAPEDGRRGPPAWFRRPLAEFQERYTAAQLDTTLRVLEPGATLGLDDLVSTASGRRS
jgi:L-ascorbate metabolism protein UlaG (beta-lactamase superfamily)